MSIPRSWVGLKPPGAEVDTRCVAADPLDPFATDSLQPEQERAVRGLRESYAAGACTLDELTQRIAAVYAARTPTEVRDAAAGGGAGGGGPPRGRARLPDGERARAAPRPRRARPLGRPARPDEAVREVRHLHRAV